MEQTIETVILCAGLLTLAPASACAAEGGGLRSVFELGASSRSLGMGGACTAIPDDGAAFLRNPAILGTLRQKEISTFHAAIAVDTAYDALGYAHPFSLGAGGINVSRSATQDIPLTANSVVPLGTFDSEQWQGVLGFGAKVWRNACVGASVKYRRMKTAEYADSGMGMDAGLYYPLSSEIRDLQRFGVRNLGFALSFSNLLSPEIHLDAASDRMPVLIRPALAYRFISPSAAGALWGTLEGEFVQGGDTLVKGGAEYAFRSRYFARAGWDGYGPTAGAGFLYRGFRLDYAFGKPELGASHRFSLSYRFGQVSDKEQSQRIMTLKIIARTYEEASEYNRAIESWKRVLAEAPSDLEALEGMGRCQNRRDGEIQERLDRARKAIERNDIPGAVPDITGVLSLDPGNQDALKLMTLVDRKMLITQNYMQGLEAYQAGDYQTAVKFLDMVRSIEPGYRDTAALYSDAKSHLTPLDAMPKDLAVLYAAGIDHFVNGEYEKAIASWEAVLKKSPGHYLVQRNIAEARERLKRSPRKNEGK